MELRITMKRLTVAPVFFLPVGLATAPAEPAWDRAEEVREATGITGGLIVRAGCGNGELPAALQSGNGCLVHGLDADSRNVGTRTATPGSGWKVPQLTSEL